GTLGAVDRRLGREAVRGILDRRDAGLLVVLKRADANAPHDEMLALADALEDEVGIVLAEDRLTRHGQRAGSAGDVLEREHLEDGAPQVPQELPGEHGLAATSPTHNLPRTHKIL